MTRQCHRLDKCLLISFTLVAAIRLPGRLNSSAESLLDMQCQVSFPPCNKVIKTCPVELLVAALAPVVWACIPRPRNAKCSCLYGRCNKVQVQDKLSLSCDHYKARKIISTPSRCADHRSSTLQREYSSGRTAIRESHIPLFIGVHAFILVLHSYITASTIRKSWQSPLPLPLHPSCGPRSMHNQKQRWRFPHQFGNSLLASPIPSNI